MTTTVGADRLAVQRLRALGDAKRLRILLLLAEGERCVCDLQDDLDVAQSLLSFHLRTLKEAGLVTDRRAGRWVHYAICEAGLREVERLLGGLRESARGAPPCTSARCCE